MKNFILLLLSFTMNVDAATRPELYFSYSAIFDQVCASIRNREIDPRMQQELQSRSDEFLSSWKKDAEPLLGTLKKLTGKEYSRSEMRVTLTVCPFISISDPFIVNMKQFLRSDRENPSPLHGFVQLVFHEYLHNFLVEKLDVTRSQLWEKYSEETAGVRAHLHLMALEKAVYLQLGRQDLISHAKYFYEVMIGGDYARSWKIATEIEDYRDFVREVASP